MNNRFAPGNGQYVPVTDPEFHFDPCPMSRTNTQVLAFHEERVLSLSLAAG